jgi:hypothetical protein
MSDKDVAQEKLRELPIKPGDRFRHYKADGVYEVVTLAVKEDTLEPLVVYRSLGHGGTIWVRTYENWSQEVDDAGTIKARFTRLF